jgi:hypothetical protein
MLSYSGSHRHVGVQQRQATLVLCRCHQKAYRGHITLNSLNKGDLLQAIFSIGGQYHHDAAWISLLTLLDTLYECIAHYLSILALWTYLFGD